MILITLSASSFHKSIPPSPTSLSSIKSSISYPLAIVAIVVVVVVVSFRYDYSIWIDISPLSPPPYPLHSISTPISLRGIEIDIYIQICTGKAKGEGPKCANSARNSNIETKGEILLRPD